MINPFRHPNHREMIARELEEARRGLLEACSARDYAAAIVEYNIQRIKRLENEVTSPADKSTH